MDFMDFLEVFLPILLIGHISLLMFNCYATFQCVREMHETIAANHQQRQLEMSGRLIDIENLQSCPETTNNEEGA